MKTINYTGSSKLISRIVHLLNRKAPLPLDGDGDADWGTSGQVLTTDGSGSTSWTTPQSGGDVTDVEVNGTSVVDAQGVANVTVPTATSDLNNDSGFITNLVNDLANYYTKSQTYTQAEVNALISGIVTLNILVVQTLPTQDISTTTIYLVPKQDTGTDDIYDEYLYINNAWELIGTTQIDLSNYVTTTDLSTALADYVTSVGLATILADYAQISDIPTDYVSKASGGEFNGGITVNKSNSGTSTVESVLSLGNNVADGNTGASWGTVFLYGQGANWTKVQAPNSSANRVITLPNKDGTVALTTDVPASAVSATNDADGNDIRDKYVNVFNSAEIGDSTSVTFNDLAAAGNAVGMINPATDNPTGSTKWVHGINLAWNKGLTSWVSQIAVNVNDDDGEMYYRHSNSSGSVAGRIWKKLIDSSNIKPKAYVAKGLLFTDNVDGTTSVYGLAYVYLQCGWATIKVMGQFTAIKSSSSGSVGMSASVLSSLNANIPSITPYSGGVLQMYHNNVLDSSYNGYGGVLAVSGTRWTLSRMYTTGGSVGAWAPAKFSVGDYIVGECYGTYTFS